MNRHEEMIATYLLDAHEEINSALYRIEAAISLDEVPNIASGLNELRDDLKAAAEKLKNLCRK